MRYIDTGSRDQRDTLAAWFATVLGTHVTELRWQSGFFFADGASPLVHTIERMRGAGALVHAVVGANIRSTLREDIRWLAEVLGVPRANARLGLVGFAGGLYHPKCYHVRRGDGSQAAYVGSANLTLSAVSGKNIEAAVALDTREGDTSEVLDAVARAVDFWFEANREGVTLIDGEASIQTAYANGLLVDALPSPRDTPAEVADEAGDEVVQEDRRAERRPVLRPLVNVGRVRAREVGAVTTAIAVEAGLVPGAREPAAAAAVAPPGIVPAQVDGISCFVMTLQQTDVGVGQTTAGTSRRSPEVFIPLIALDQHPAFWTFPEQFTPDVAWNSQHANRRNGLGKMDRMNVPIRIGAIQQVSMFFNPRKGDFRLRNEALRSSGSVGDILLVRLVDGVNGFEYDIQVAPQGSPHFAQLAPLCNRPVPNSPKRFGYF